MLISILAPIIFIMFSPTLFDNIVIFLFALGVIAIALACISLIRNRNANHRYATTFLASCAIIIVLAFVSVILGSVSLLQHFFE